MKKQWIWEISYTYSCDQHTNIMGFFRMLGNESLPQNIMFLVMRFLADSKSGCSEIAISKVEKIGEICVFFL